MSPRSHQRRVLLFAIALIAPSLVLVALGARMIGQERELAEKRVIEEQQRLLSDIRRELLAKLERIKLQEVSALAAEPGRRQSARYEHPAVVLVSQVENGRLVLPWEAGRAAEVSQQLLGEGVFARQIQAGEQEEFAWRRFDRAAALYRQAHSTARHPTQVAYAQLLLARVLARAGRYGEAAALHRKILPLSAEASDEHGVPLSLYAAERLLEAGGEWQAVSERLQAESEALRWPPPAKSYILRDLTNRLAESPAAQQRGAAQELHRRILQEVRRTEQALALQNDFPTLLPLQASGKPYRNSEPSWFSYGEEIWLVSLAPPLGDMPPAVVAVRAAEVFASLESVNRRSNDAPGKVELVTGGEAKGEPLGQNFPGLKAAFAGRDDRAAASRWNLQSLFYLLALMLVLGVTLFGAYLLWRDVRRELHVAELRSQFVSSVSHELKTPLTAIRMFAETLRMGRSLDRQTENEYLDTIVSESERLTRLLGNVLDFSKIEQGKKTYAFAPTSLAEVVRTSARALESPLARQGFSLRVSVEDELPRVNADGDALQQAVLNLLTNAMKYSGESRELDLRLYREDGHAVIAVTDRGLGIAPEEQARIFEQFYRVPTPETKLIPGTGLGLTLVAHAAQAHGAHVKVRSVSGAGSTFSIHLPLEAER